ncbi:hypothetical protein D3C74_301270 [compost metagenome]
MRRACAAFVIGERGAEQPLRRFAHLIDEAEQDVELLKRGLKLALPRHVSGSYVGFVDLNVASAGAECIAFVADIRRPVHNRITMLPQDIINLREALVNRGQRAFQFLNSADTFPTVIDTLIRNMMHEQAVGPRFDYVVFAARFDSISDRICRNRHATFGIDAALMQFIALVNDVSGDMALNVQIWHDRNGIAGQPADNLAAGLFDPIDPRDVYRFEFLARALRQFREYDIRRDRLYNRFERRFWRGQAESGRLADVCSRIKVCLNKRVTAIAAADNEFVHHLR